MSTSPPRVRVLSLNLYNTVVPEDFNIQFKLPAQTGTRHDTHTNTQIIALKTTWSRMKRFLDCFECRTKWFWLVRAVLLCVCMCVCVCGCVCVCVCVWLYSWTFMHIYSIMIFGYSLLLKHLAVLKYALYFYYIWTSIFAICIIRVWYI